MPNFREVLSPSFAVIATVICTFALAQSDTKTSVILSDTADGGGAGGGVFFILTAIDGGQVSENALNASLRASRGRGAYMTIAPVSRAVPAGTATLSLQGTEATAAPIQSIFRSIFRDGNRQVSGTVKVDLPAEHRYRVNGIIDAFKREVWIEDETGIQVPGSRIAAESDPELMKAMQGATFTATNLHYDGDWISEVAKFQLPLIPAGSMLKVIDWGKGRANVLVDGRRMRVGIDESGDVETIQQLVARITSPTDPRLAIREYPENVRNAIRLGRVMAGMTKDQVRLALGRPRVDFVPSLEASEWRYDTSDYGPVYLLFDDKGLLKELDASRPARALLLVQNQ
jgi:hypothetical protein